MKTKIIFILLCVLSLNVMGQGIITRNKKPKTTQTQPTQTQPTKTHRQAQGKLKTKTASKPKPVSEPEAAGYDVTFSCNVSSATLYIDGNANGNASGSRFLKTGNHTIKVSAEGYKDYQKSISVNRQNTSCRIVLEKASKVKTLSLNDFFPIEGITLGKTTWSEAERLGFIVEAFEGGSSRVTSFSNGFNLWDHGGKGIFTHIYAPHYGPMFPLWKNLGMSWDLSWNEWLEFFKSHGFSVKITESPVTKIYNGRNTLSGEFSATSSDGSISFRLEFRYGNKNGEGYSVTSKESLDTITIGSK